MTSRTSPTLAAADRFDPSAYSDYAGGMIVLLMRAKTLDLSSACGIMARWLYEDHIAGVAAMPDLESTGHRFDAGQCDADHWRFNRA